MLKERKKEGRGYTEEKVEGNEKGERERKREKERKG